MRVGRRARRVLVAAALIGLATPSTRAAAPIRFEFKVPALAGGTLSSQDIKGKIAVIDVWATWCGPCRMVIPRLVKLQDKFKDKGVTVIGLNSDEDASSGPGLESVKRFVREHDINYPVSYTHLRAHETPEHLVCRLLL